jgi:hypothetical protein
MVVCLPNACCSRVLQHTLDAEMRTECCICTSLHICNTLKFASCTNLLSSSAACPAQLAPTSLTQPWPQSDQHRQS